MQEKEEELELDPFLLNSDSTTNQSSPRKMSQIKINTTELTVQYLSPLVIRKELENIIINNDSQEYDECCFIDEKFMNDHKIVFWNLIWYFKRIGVDSGHLATVLLNSRINALKSQFLDQDKNEAQNEFKYKEFIPNQLGKTYTQHPNVKIKCMWDNLNLHDENTSHEVPLYYSWLNTNYSKVQDKNKNRLVTILSQSEIKSIRKSSINSRSLYKLHEQIIRNIKESDIIVPFRTLLMERIRSKMNFSSVYREILFLVIIALERDLIDIGNLLSDFIIGFNFC